MESSGIGATGRPLGQGPPGRASLGLCSLGRCRCLIDTGGSSESLFLPMLRGPGLPQLQAALRQEGRVAHGWTKHVPFLPPRDTEKVVTMSQAGSISWSGPFQQQPSGIAFYSHSWSRSDKSWLWVSPLSRLLSALLLPITISFHHS